MSLVSFYTPWKHQKTKDFPMFSGGIERDQWDEIGQRQQGIGFIKNKLVTYK